MGQSPSQRALAEQTAREAGIDPDLFIRMISQESAWNPRAVSPAGAQGLGQLMPQTAKELGVTDPFNEAQNLRGSATYLGRQMNRFQKPELALAAYNAGPEA